MQNVEIKFYPNPPVVEQNVTFELSGTMSKSTHAHKKPNTCTDNMYADTHMCTHTTHIHAHTNMYTHTHARMHTRMHAHTHTRTHTHTHPTL